jgi:hypothetical protein
MAYVLTMSFEIMPLRFSQIAILFLLITVSISVAQIESDGQKKTGGDVRVAQSPDLSSQDLSREQLLKIIEKQDNLIKALKVRVAELEKQIKPAPVPEKKEK